MITNLRMELFEALEPGLPAADRRMGAEYDDGDYSDYYYYDDYAQEHKDTNQSNHEPLHDF